MIHKYEVYEVITMLGVGQLHLGKKPTTALREGDFHYKGKEILWGVEAAKCGGAP